MITLSAEQRKETLSALRAADKIPAVYYGQGSDAVSVVIDAKEFAKVYKEAGETATLDLMIGAEKIPVIIKDIQRDAIYGNPIHVDFFKVDMKQELEITIPLEFIGIAEAEKNGLGTLVKVLHEVLVKSLPANIPQSIEVDVSVLNTLEDQIKAGDLKLPSGVSLITNADEAVALVTPFAEEKEDLVLDVSSVEVEKKGKKEQDEE